MTTLARLNIVVDADAAKRQLRSLEQVAKRSAGIIQGAFQRSLSIFQGLTRQIFSLRSAFLGLGAGLIVRDFIKVANTLEQVKFQMVAVTKDTKVANQIFKNTRQFATEVSFSFEDLVGASNRMAAQLKGDIDQVDFFLRASADVAAVTGMSVDDAASQFMRLMAGGTGAADTFRERGVLAMMGFEHGATYSLDQVEKKIKSAFKEGGSVIAGVAPQMATTFSGSLSMIGDKVFELKSRVMEAGVFDFLKDAADFINLELDAALQTLGNNAATVGTRITGFLDDMVIYAAGTVDGLVNTTKAALQFFDSVRAAYNKFNDFAGGELASLGLIGFIIFGKKGGIIGIIVATLAGIADYISGWISTQIANIIGMAKNALPDKGYKEGLASGTAREAFSNKGYSIVEQNNMLLKLQGKSQEKRMEVYADYGVFPNADGTFRTESQYLGRFGKQKTALEKAEMGFRTDAQSYKDGDLGFRHTAGQMIERLKQEGYIPSTQGANMGALGIELDTFTGAGDMASKFFDFLEGRRSTRAAQANQSAYEDAAYGGSRASGTSPTTPPSSGPTKPLAAHLLQAQMNTELEKMIGLLQTGEMTFDEFNSQKELMGQLIAAEIPLVGQLTAEQQKEKDNIIALQSATDKYNNMLERLGLTYSNTASKFSEGFMAAAAAAGDAAEVTMQFGTQMYQSLEDGLDKFLRTGKFNFQSFMREMAHEFLIQTAKMAMAKMATAMFGGFMAGGGQMAPNRAYVVGERGREVFVPNEAGRLLSNDQLGGGGVTINQSFDFRNADHTTEARLRQQAAIIQENTRRSIYQDMQDGGSVSKLTGRR